MKEQKKIIQISSVQEFYANTGLYDRIEIQMDNYQMMEEIVFGRKPVNCFCVKCSRDSVFTFKSIYPPPPLPSPPHPLDNPILARISMGPKGYFSKEFQCARNENHSLIFHILVDGKEICKIGQFPSLADISIPINREYQKILGAYYSEFNKAIGLFAHGVGVGAFVYLRRIIENFIISPAYEEARQKSDWDEGKYKNSRVSEKIRLLKDCLPNFLVENTVIYSIISKGIHELTEKECLEYFPVLKSCLEVILTDLEAKRQQDQKRQEMKAALSKISTGIGGSSTSQDT